jgi:hypothetical protein
MVGLAFCIDQFWPAAVSQVLDVSRFMELEDINFSLPRMADMCFLSRYLSYIPGMSFSPEERKE